MSDTKISGLTEDTSPATGDYLVTVDVSDTTMAASGTDKKVQASNLYKGLATGTPSSSNYLRGDGTWNTPTNTTYTAMSVSEGETGTATTSRTVRADYLKTIINYFIGLGTSAKATILETARTINGVSFDGSANITIADSTKVPTTTTVNGHALSSNVTVSASDVGLGNVDNTSDATKNSATATLTNKTLTTPTIAQINNSSGVKLQLDTQTDNSNSISSAQTSGVRMQFGWGQVVGNGASTITDSVIFPTAFTTVYGVVATLMGNSSGAASDATGLNQSYTSTTAFIANAYAPTTTGFSVGLSRSSGVFNTSTYYGYSWIAWGV